MEIKQEILVGLENLGKISIKHTLLEGMELYNKGDYKLSLEKFYQSAISNLNEENDDIKGLPYLEILKKIKEKDSDLASMINGTIGVLQNYLSNNENLDLVILDKCIIETNNYFEHFINKKNLESQSKKNKIITSRLREEFSEIYEEIYEESDLNSNLKRINKFITEYGNDSELIEIKLMLLGEINKNDALLYISEIRKNKSQSLKISFLIVLLLSIFKRNDEAFDYLLEIEQQYPNEIEIKYIETIYIIINYIYKEKEKDKSKLSQLSSELESKSLSLQYANFTKSMLGVILKNQLDLEQHKKTNSGYYLLKIKKAIDQLQEKGALKEEKEKEKEIAKKQEEEEKKKNQEKQKLVSEAERKRREEEEVQNQIRRNKEITDAQNAKIKTGCLWIFGFFFFITVIGICLK